MSANIMMSCGYNNYLRLLQINKDFIKMNHQLTKFVWTRNPKMMSCLRSSFTFQSAGL